MFTVYMDSYLIIFTSDLESIKITIMIQLIINNKLISDKNYNN